jgi:hypothetical protein
MSLVLSGLITFGAWQVVRSSRYVRLGFAPDWLHTGGPAQVGHAHATDLDFSNAPLCWFERPVCEPLESYHVWRPVRPGRPVNFVLAVKGPRGPPAVTREVS